MLLPNVKVKKILSFRVISLFIVFALIAYGVFWWVSNRKDTKAHAQPFSTAKVTRGNIEVVVKDSGALQAANLINIKLKSGSTVKKVYIKAGDTVKKGDPLYELEGDELQISLEKSRLNIEQQQMNLNEALKQREDTVVYAPCDGIVKTLAVREGDSVNTGTSLATIVNQDITEVQVPFLQNQIKNIKVGQEADVFFIDYLSSIKGTVTNVSTVGNPQPNGSIYFYVTVSMNGDYYTEGQERLVEVTVDTGEGNSEKSVEYGTIKQHEPTEVKPKIDGTLAKIYVDEGDKVKKGQKLFSITNDNIEQNIEKQQLSLEQAKLDYASITDQINDLIVRSPIDGTVMEQNMDEGDIVQDTSSSGSSGSSQSSSSSGVAAVIADFSSMSVVISVDELDVNKIKTGMPAKLTAEAVPGKTFNGVVEQIAEQGVNQNNTATFDVTIKLKKDPELKVGMTMDAELTVAKAENVLMLPINAIQQRDGKSYVLTADNNTSGSSSNNNLQRSDTRRTLGQSNQASNFNSGDYTSNNIGKSSSRMQGKLVEVQTGLSNDDYIEIKSGLNEGDQVIIPISSNSYSTTNRRNQGFGGGPGMPGPGPIQIRR